MFRFARVKLAIFSEIALIGLGDAMEMVGKEKVWSQMPKVSNMTV